MAGSYHGSILKISWVNFKDRHESMNIFFQWTKLKHAIPTRLKALISNDSDIDKKTLYRNNHVIKGARILPTTKLSSKEIHLILISNIFFNIYFEKLIENTTP